MKVLVTGGAGFIGSHTVDALLEKGHEVRILDNLQKPVHLKGKPEWVPSDAEFVLGDVRDKGVWERCLEGVDAVYHFAAYQDYLPDFSTFFHVNAVGTALLYEVAVEKRMDLAKVVVASSQFVQGEGLYRCRSADCAEKKCLTQRRKGAKNLRESDDLRRFHEKDGVFGGVIRSEGQLRRGEWEMLCPECGEPGEWLWTPESYVAPPNAYAMSKHSQEMQALTFGRRYGIPSVALRYSIVQGPRQSFYNAYSGACRIFSLNYYFDKAPTLYEDGLQCRDFVNIHDVVRANLMALEDERMDYEVFNVGGGKAYTVLEFAGIVKGQMSEVRSHPGEMRSAVTASILQGKEVGDQRSEVQKRRRLEGEKVRRKDEHRTPASQARAGRSNVQHRTSNGKTEDRGHPGEMRSAVTASISQGKEVGRALPEAEVPGLYRFGDTRNACSDISKIRALGWEPQNSPVESVREYVEWLYEQDNVEDILEYAKKTMKEMDVVRSAD
jgi:dTDP-L-rhamnose 4-epimerase